MAKRQLSSVSADPIGFETLHEGVPSWMLNSLMSWFETILVKRRNSIPYGARDDLIRQTERKLHLIIARGGAMDSYNDLMYKVSINGELALDVAETILVIMSQSDLGLGLIGVTRPAAKLEEILSESGSKWTLKLDTPIDSDVASLNPRLEERVDATIQMQAERLSQAGQSFSGHLSSAWSNAYGRNPNSGEAFSDAIKAVEAASWPVVMPNDNTATIGKIAGELKATKDRWHTQMPNSTAQKEDVGVDLVILMMLQLLENHSDRHATGKHEEISSEKAQQAVADAIYLCDVFGNGLISKKLTS